MRYCRPGLDRGVSLPGNEITLSGHGAQYMYVCVHMETECLGSSCTSTCSVTLVFRRTDHRSRLADKVRGEIRCTVPIISICVVVYLLWGGSYYTLSWLLHVDHWKNTRKLVGKLSSHIPYMQQATITNWLSIII